MSLRIGIAVFLVTAVLVAPAAAREKDAGGPAVKHKREIMAELKRLNIVTTGEPNQFDEKLPKDLMAGPGWGVATPTCRAAGYDLKRYAGKEVLVTVFPIQEPGDPRQTLTATVVTHGKKIACVYKADKAVIPGVYPANMTSRQLRNK